MPVEVITEVTGFEQLTAQSQAAILETLRENIEIIEAAVKEEAPEDTGNLKEHLSIGQIIAFGAHRFQVNIEVNLEKVPYYYAVIRGFPEQEVGQPGKKYSPAPGLVWVGPWTLPAREPNNFAKRAVRKIGPEIVGLTARNFITRVAQ
jgi:hypothetical protein